MKNTSLGSNFWIFMLILCGLLMAGAAGAQEKSETFLSLRTGFAVNDNDEGFRQYEIFDTFRLPVKFNIISGLSMQIRLDANASWLTQDGESALILSAGPGFLLSKPGGRFAVKLGVSPTFLSSPKFPRKDLGGPFHFISHFGFMLRVGQNWGLVYRIQHLSNASIVQPNPGLNLHILGLWLGCD